ncbi:MAG: enoyl-CoA hydratase-related protein [Acidimicrobiales bacterium]
MSRLDTGTEHLLADVEDRVAVLTLNRPEARNALHPEIFDAMARLLPALAEDPDVGCLVLTGAGRAFCAGGDVKAMNARNSGAAPALGVEGRIDDLRRRQSAVAAGLAEFPKVTLAAIPGAAAGAGLSIALACDVRVAAESAILTTAFVKVGFSGDFGGSWFITQLIGAAKARELYLTGDRLSAAEAKDLGLVNWVAPDDEFEQAWRTRAAAFANGPLLAQRYIKENINRAIGSDLRTHLDAEAIAMSRLGTTEDHREAAQAFVEKRPPQFMGR